MAGRFGARSGNFGKTYNASNPFVHSLFAARQFKDNHLDTGFYWVSSNARMKIPPNAVRGGTDSDGSAIYIGRARCNGDTCPAKLVPSRNIAYVAFAGQEWVVDNYEILCEHQFKWVQASNGHVPSDAVPGGNTNCGENLYIGRAMYQNAETVGKIHPSHKCLYISYGGQEISIKSYEVLVRK